MEKRLTLAELPEKLAQMIKQPQPQTVNIVTIPATEANSMNSQDGNGNEMEGEGNGDDEGRESYLINVKMRQGTEQENGVANGFKRTINGIAVGISRIPKNEALRKRIRESKIAVVSADVMTDMGCGALADKQKQMLSQACSIL